MTTSFAWGDQLPTLTGRRVALRALGAGDRESLWRVFSDLEVVRYTTISPLRDLAGAKHLLEELDVLFRSRALFQWGIVQRLGDDPGEVIGTCTLFHIDSTHRRGEIGYVLGRPYWGRGLARDAVATLVTFAFRSLGLHRVEADVDPRNVASIRLLEQLGFRQEGLLRERYLAHGEIQDTLFFGLLSREWSGDRRR